jgi:hypothetical protein
VSGFEPSRLFVVAVLFAPLALTATPAAAEEPKLGVEQRQLVFREALAAEERAESEAAKRFPESPESQEASDLASKLSLRYKGEVARNYGITLKQVAEITAEGYMNGWPVESRPAPVESLD